MKIKISNSNVPAWKDVTVKSRIPADLKKLEEMARNIWWAWNNEATDLAGFGLWVNSLKGGYAELKDGVKVIHRSDYNYSEVADAIKDAVSEFSSLTDAEIKKIRKNAANIAEKALWKHFIKYYYEAYDVALRNAQKRLTNR